MQENAADLPPGDTPLVMSVVCHGETVGKARPGDRVRMTGELTVVPDAPSIRGRLSRGSGGGTEATGRRNTEIAQGTAVVGGAASSRALTHTFLFSVSHVMPETIARQPNVAELVQTHRGNLTETMFTN